MQEIEKKGQLAKQEYLRGNAVFLARLQVRGVNIGTLKLAAGCAIACVQGVSGVLP